MGEPVLAEAMQVCCCLRSAAVLPYSSDSFKVVFQLSVQPVLPVPDSRLPGPQLLFSRLVQSLCFGGASQPGEKYPKSLKDSGGRFLLTTQPCVSSSLWLFDTQCRKEEREE